MASESYFRGTFCTEIIRAYSKEKFTNARIQAVWSCVKTYADEALKLALEESTKPAHFPGADKIIEACARFQGQYRDAEIAKAKSEKECGCSNGIRQAAGFAYQCSNCKLGALMVPNLPVYNGEPMWTDKTYQDNEGNNVLETRTHIYRSPPGARAISDFSFSIKTSLAAVTRKFDKPKLIKANEYSLENF